MTQPVDYAKQLTFYAELGGKTVAMAQVRYAAIGEAAYLRQIGVNTSTHSTTANVIK